MQQKRVSALIWWPGWSRRTSRSGRLGCCGSPSCWACGSTQTERAPCPPPAPACWGRRSAPWWDHVCFQTTWLPPAERHRLAQGWTREWTEDVNICISTHRSWTEASKGRQTCRKTSWQKSQLLQKQLCMTKLKKSAGKLRESKKTFFLFWFLLWNSRWLEFRCVWPL